jgi:hypothetical protein
MNMQPSNIAYRNYMVLLTLAWLAGCSDSDRSNRTQTSDEILSDLKLKGSDNEISVPVPVSPEGRSTATNKPVFLDREQSLPSLQGGKQDSIAEDASKASPENAAPVLKATPTEIKTIKKNIEYDDPKNAWVAGVALPITFWELTYVGNDPAGFSERTITRATRQGSEKIIIDFESVLRVRMDNTVSRQTLILKSQEKENGELLDLDTQLRVGTNAFSYRGSPLGSKFQFSAKGTSTGARNEIDWNEDYRGPFAVEESLIRERIGKNEIRILEQLDPVLGRVIETRLEAMDWAPTPTMLGSKNLLEIQVSNRDQENISKSTIWMDENGFIVKSYFPASDLRVFRVDKQTWTDLKQIFELQFLELTEIPIDLKGGDPESYRRAVGNAEVATFRIRNSNRDPFRNYSKRTNQRIVSKNSLTIDVSVFSIGNQTTLPLGLELESDSGAVSRKTRSTSWIKPESQRLAVLSDSLAKEYSLEPSAEVYTRALSLRDGVAKRYEYQPFDRKVRKLDVFIRAKKLNGFEHAILLASLCRNNSIPCRLAIGMASDVDSAAPKMGLHAWVECYAKDRWYPLDSSRQSSIFALDHIKISESDADVDFFDEIANAADWMSDIREITILLDDSK